MNSRIIATKNAREQKTKKSQRKHIVKIIIWYWSIRCSFLTSFEIHEFKEIQSIFQNATMNRRETKNHYLTIIICHHIFIYAQMITCIEIHSRVNLFYHVCTILFSWWIYFSIFERHLETNEFFQKNLLSFAICKCQIRKWTFQLFKILCHDSLFEFHLPI